MATVPMFAPDGTLGDIPHEQMMAALRAGAKPGVTIKAPDGSLGVVPADRYQEAVKAGAQIVPLKEQETQHPGFWATVAGDLKGLLHPSGFSPYPGMGQEEKSAAAGQAYEQDQARKQAGYSTPYRALAPVAQAVGANVPGMEESAAAGDEAGVYGHAAAPIATLAASELAHQAGPSVVKNPTVGKVAGTVADVTKGAAKLADITAFERFSKAAKTIQDTAGKVKERWQQPAPEVAPPAEQAAPSPESTPVAAAPNPTAAPEAPAQVQGAGIPRTLSGDSALRQILTGQDNPNLLKIARSRGVDVSQESQLKPGVADNRLINKIIDSYSPEELDEVGAKYLENTRMGKHDFGEIGPEAWKTMSMQQYFPDVKVSQAALKRTQGAIQNAAKARTVEVDPQTGKPEFSDVIAKKGSQQTAPEGSQGAGSGSDLTAQLQASLDMIRAKKGGSMTKADPSEIVDRWKDQPDAGMGPGQTEEYIQKLADSYKSGRAVEPVMETRDASGKITAVDGKARAIAAARAGVKEIPVMVRQIGKKITR